MTASRQIYDVRLRPVLGSSFQPTGFPDLGAATFDKFENGKIVSSLLVESVQSMANRLEATAWDNANQAPVETMNGLPYVRVVRAGTDKFLTSSRLEAHRLFSAFIRDSMWGGDAGDAVLLKALDIHPDTPLSTREMARAIVALDPFSLLHGVFFAGQTKAKGSRPAWPAQPKFARAVSAIIEAYDVSRLVYGGRKSDAVRHQSEEAGGSTEGYGSVPFTRTEWTAREIVASFVIDAELIDSYGLPSPLSKLLTTVAQWEIRSLLEGGLRLRTACDLELVDDVASRRGEPLPELAELDSRVRELVSASAPSLGDGAAITVEWTPPKGNKKSGEEKA